MHLIYNTYFSEILNDISIYQFFINLIKILIFFVSAEINLNTIIN